MTKVAILWHMHQPFYEDLVTREHILPWVRLHALKDYYGMVALLREFPDVRMTFNLVPSLLVQLEAFAQNRARDHFLDLSLKPAEALSEADAVFMLENFFHAQHQRMIEPYQRYAELFTRRGDLSRGNGRAAARRFSRDDLRDLQVWHKLAWVDPMYLAQDPRCRALLEKGSGFTEEDKGALRDVELELLGRVIPEYRAASERGQIELSTSPFYHPILPLLCDSHVYLYTHPDSPMPRHRFVHPEDAADQLKRAVDLHQRLFGRRPVGLWPSEGSVSDAMVPLAVRAGFRWMATDELILGRTKGTTFGRDAEGHLFEPERLYAPFGLNRGGDGTIACLFRDHVLSDLIGFSYAGWSAEEAARDFVSRLTEAGRRFAARTGGEDATIAVILDGENAWEHFEGGGRPFLRALYRQLSTGSDLRTVTMAEACANPRRELSSIFPGSWIDANFYIWIGHPDDQRAWSQLADARLLLDEAAGGAGVDPGDLAQAREEVLIAEGSDWFWWYGDDHSSANDREFDDLFRRHLRNAYSLLHRPVPDELFVSNITTGRAATIDAAPTGLVTPTLDGEDTSYFEWLGAGSVEGQHAAGTMHRGEARTALLRLVHVGFDETHFFVRFDGERPMAEVLADGYELALTFLKPEGLRFSIRDEGHGPVGRLRRRAADEAPGRTSDRPDNDLHPVAARMVVEAGLRLAALGVGAGAPLSFFVTVCDGQQHEIERLPASATIDVTVPDAGFESRNWSA